MSPGFLVPRVVRLSVSGIKPTSNQPSVSPGGPWSSGALSAETVRLIPSTAIEPFSTTYREILPGRLMRT